VERLWEHKLDVDEDNDSVRNMHLWSAFNLQVCKP
jgi:hypothetical protein